MDWINFLHIYQPIDQSKEILNRVVNESYRPLLEGFLKIKNVKINLNINGALTELLAKNGYQDIIEAIKRLATDGKLEFTESAKYHPLLPLLKEKEIIRQVSKNYQTNKNFFGKIYRPVCFFPPEMAFSHSLAKTVSKMGYPMIILDEISFDGGKNFPPNNQLLTIKGTNKLIAVFRERRVSNCIMSAVIRNQKEFLELIKDDLKQEKYLCTAMDGETFGHHRPGMEKILLRILRTEKPRQLFFSQLPKYYKIDGEVEPVTSTWAATKEDIDQNVQFYSWKDPKNKIHRLQRRFLEYLLKIAASKKLSSKIQEKIDRAMASDHFFWASGEPWWSVEMIEKGAWTILQTLKSLPGAKDKETKRGEELYKEIISMAFWWQRSGKIEEKAKKYREAIRIPFKERTIGKGEPEVYYAFCKLMEKKMKEAARKKNFERAILWRDAIWKLETKNDIYDAIHAVDLLRQEVPDSTIRNLIKKYKDKYNRIKPGQPEERGI